MRLVFEDWLWEDDAMILLAFGASVSVPRLIFYSLLLDWEIHMTGASQMLYGPQRGPYILLSPNTGMLKKKKALKLLRNGRSRYGNIKLLLSPIIKIILNIMLVILLIKEKNRRFFRGRYTC